LLIGKEAGGVKQMGVVTRAKKRRLDEESINQNWHLEEEKT